MKIHLSNAWRETRESYWFIPSMMILGAICLSFLTIAVDRSSLSDNLRLQLLWGGDAEGARGLMEVIASSMVTVATLTFSLTIVAFTQASAQFGPRLLRNFARDSGNKVVLGTFIATFVYCLLVLRAIRTGIDGQPEFVPYFSVSTGFLLGLASLGVLIYFIHHVSQAIYAPNLIASVAADLLKTIEDLLPWDEEDNPTFTASEKRSALPPDFEKKAVGIKANSSGYLQMVDYINLLAIAVDNNLTMLIIHRPGHFIPHDADVVLVSPAGPVSPAVLRSIRSSFTLGKHRVAPQDVEFAIDQLVEVAVRALSPAINDPFTAMNCIDWLGVALSRLAVKRIPPPYLTDSSGVARVHLKHPITFKGVTEAAFNQIRQQAGNHVSVLIRLLEVLASIAEHTHDEQELIVLERQAKMIKRSSHRLLRENEDLADVDERYQRIEDQDD